MSHGNLPWVESPFFKEILQTKNISETDKELAKQYNEDGFIVVPNLFTEKEIEDALSDIQNKAFNPDYPVKTYRDQQRVQDFWQESEAVKHLSCHPKVLPILEMLYGREVVPFQTLNFRVGTGQRAHSDTIHFSSIPARFMCGVWIALEDINHENGAVFYYPKSHKIPEYNFAHIKDGVVDTSYDNYSEYEDFIQKVMDSSEFERKPFYAKKGDALIWSSNIIHGGSKVEKAGSSRWSQVTHYYFKDCVYYTPMLSNMVTNELYLRHSLVNMRTGKRVEQTFNGNPIRYVETGKDKFILNNRMKENEEGQPTNEPVFPEKKKKGLFGFLKKIFK